MGPEDWKRFFFGEYADDVTMKEVTTDGFRYEPKTRLPVLSQKPEHPKNNRPEKRPDSARHPDD